MNRKDFFKKLGFGVIGIALVSRVVAEIKETKEQPLISNATKRTNWNITGEKYGEFEPDSNKHKRTYTKAGMCRNAGIGV